MAKLGVLVYPRKLKERATAAPYFDNFAYRGLRAVIGEVDKRNHAVRYIAPHQIDECDFVLVSLTSAWDILSLIHYVPIRRRAKIIAGGQGLVNPRPFMQYLDLAVFGRAEGQINELIDGGRGANVLDVGKDPAAEGNYEYRQAQYLLGDEADTGCIRKCFFCGYGWTHRSLNRGGNYQASDDALYSSSEQFLSELRLTENVHYSAGLDGWSEASRRSVGKPFSNTSLVEKLKTLTEDAAARGWARLSLKLYMIHAYPWEKPLADYTGEMARALADLDGKLSSGRLVIFFKATPFCPEPMTPMARCLPCFDDAWRTMLKNQWLVYQGSHVEARIHMTVPSAAELAHMVFFRRAGREESSVAEMMSRPKYLSLTAGLKLAALSVRGVLGRLTDAAPWSGLRVPGLNPERVASQMGWTY